MFIVCRRAKELCNSSRPFERKKKIRKVVFWHFPSVRFSREKEKTLESKCQESGEMKSWFHGDSRAKRTIWRMVYSTRAFRCKLCSFYFHKVHEDARISFFLCLRTRIMNEKWRFFDGMQGRLEEKTSWRIAEFFEVILRVAQDADGISKRKESWKLQEKYSNFNYSPDQNFVEWVWWIIRSFRSLVWVFLSFLSVQTEPM